MSSNFEEDTRGPLERAYDEEISPLMTQVIELSKKHNINMMMSFQLDTDEEQGSAMLCTTALVPEEADSRLKGAVAALFPRSRPAINLTTYDKDGQITQMTRII